MTFQIISPYQEVDPKKLMRADKTSPVTPMYPLSTHNFVLISMSIRKVHLIIDLHILILKIETHSQHRNPKREW